MCSPRAAYCLVSAADGCRRSSTRWAWTFINAASAPTKRIQSLRSLWRENPSGFHGKHFNFGPVNSFPKPAQKGGVPIHVGGHSPAAAKRAARFGDGFFPALGELAKLNELFGLMKTECRKIGRNPAEIEVSCMGRAKLDALKALQDIGISRVVLPPPAFDKDGLSRGLEKLASEVIARL